jgi:hypothetical protein
VTLALARAGADDRKADAAAAHEEAERQAAAELAAETLALANRQAGDPLGQLGMARSALGVAQDKRGPAGADGEG